MSRGALDWIKAATLAPSTHNTQPWRFAFDDVSIRLYPDLTRALPAADPRHRELYVSLGGALENLIQAAVAEGWSPEVDLFPVDEPLGCVRVTFRREGVDEAPLAEMIRRRQTNRRPYDRRPLDEDSLRLLESIQSERGVHFRVVAERDHFSPFAGLVAMADHVLFSNAAYRSELMSWLRFSPAEARRRRDGISVAALGLPHMPRWMAKRALHATLQPRRIIRRDLALIDRASALLVLYSDEDDRATWIGVGRTLERLLLQATALGLQQAYLNQPCEVPWIREQMVVRLPSDARFPQMLLRLGYAPPLPRSLRRPLEHVLVARVPPSRPAMPSPEAPLHS